MTNGEPALADDGDAERRVVPLRGARGARERTETVLVVHCEKREAAEWRTKRERRKGRTEAEDAKEQFVGKVLRVELVNP